MCSASIAAREAYAGAATYGFLAGVLSLPPTRESVQALRQVAESLGIWCPETFSLSDLEREYMVLFVVPNSRYVAPYESVFRDEWSLPLILRPGSNPGEIGSTKIKGLLMGDSTLEVRRAYLQAGVLPEDDLPDHIANELRFMAHLWAREAESDEGSPALTDLRQRFREEHLLKWIGPLRERVAERDRLGYYRVALQVAEKVLQEDAD